MESFLDWYVISVNLCFVTGLLFFFVLPKEIRKGKYYWIPLAILALTFFYENLASYTSFDREFNARVNAFFGNTENPRFNSWVYNIFNQYIASVFYLLLIKSWLPTSKKKYVKWMIYGYLFFILIFLVTWAEPIYLNQPITFALSANLILISCGLYFIGLITDEKFLNSKPLKLISFWQVTFFMFTYSLTYINWVSMVYLYEVNPDLGISLMSIDRVMGIFNLLILVLILAVPRLPNLFQKEPYFGT